MSYSFESNYSSLVSTVKSLRAEVVQLRATYKSIKAASEASLLEEEAVMDAMEDILDRMRSCPVDSFSDLKVAHKAAKEALKVIRSTTSSLLNQADEAGWNYQAALGVLQEAIYSARAARVKVLLDGDVLSIYVGGELVLVRTLRYTHQVVVPAVVLLSDAVVAVSSYPVTYLLSPALSSTSVVVPTTNKAMLPIFSFSLSASIHALSQAFRPATTTRAALKAAGRKAQAQASRKANRVRKPSHRTRSSVMGPVVSRAHRLAKIATKAQRRALRATSSSTLIITVGTTTHTCALPAPTLKKVVPLGSDVLPDGFRLVHRAPRKGLPLNAHHEEVRYAPATVRPGAASVTRPSIVRPLIKAEKLVSMVTSVKDAVEQEIESLHQRLDDLSNLVIAGPTTSNYGWEYISPEELAASIYGEEAPAPQPAPKQAPDHYLYSMVVCSSLGRSPQPAVGQAAANTNSNDIPPTMNTSSPAQLVPPQNVKSMFIQGTKFPLYPAKAFTTHNCPIPEGFYTLETGRVPYKSTKASISGTHTYTFAGAEGTFLLMQNSRNGSLFVKNSHIRAITPIGGEKKEFGSFLQNMLDLSVEEHNAECTASNQEYNEVYQNMITEGGMSHEEAVEALLGQGMMLMAPIKYILIETKGVKNAQGEWEYVYDDAAIQAMEAEYTAMGYQVLGIESSLLLSNITTSNFRLDGNLPCVPTSTSDLRDLVVQGIKQWDASNVHLAVKDVTDLGAWLSEVMPSVKAISFSFNSITPVKEVTSTVQNAESTVHQYSLTTPDTHYSVFNLEEGSVPAWTINLWTVAPTAASMVSQEKTVAAVTAARPWTAGTTTAKAPTMTPGGLLAQRMKQQASANAARVPGQRPAPVPANQAAVAIKPVVVAMDSVPGALYNDSVPAAVTVVDEEIDELDLLSPTVPAAKSVAAVTKVNLVLGATNSKPVSADSVNAGLASFKVSTDLDDDLCQLINLLDLPMSDTYLKALTDLTSSLGLTIQSLPADSPNLGSYGNGVISIKHELPTNHTVQVLTHELVHAVFSQMIVDMVEALCEHWLDNVGHSSNTPAGVSIEEQFAYSFMEYPHDLATLISFLRDAFNGTDGWDAYYTQLAEAAAKTSKKAARSAAPIAIVTSEQQATVTVPNSPVLEALLNLTGSQDVIVLTDINGNLPAAYTQAFPELAVPQLALGQVAIIRTACGLVIHAVCAVTEHATLSPEALKDGLDSIAGTDTVFLCESDLGFGMGATHAPRILGAVRQALGKAKVKTISLPSMKRLAKEWSSVAGGKVSYPKCDLSLWPAALMKGTAITVVPVGSTTSVLEGGPDEITGTTVSATLAVLNDDGTINGDALAAGLVELEAHVADGGIPMPIYCYSCQKEAFKGLSVAVKPVEYSEGAGFPGVMVSVICESPIESEDLNTWYHHLLNGLKGEGNSLFQVADFCQGLYGKAFKALGIEEQLASYALSPLPTNWLRHGIVLVTRGKNARGVVERHVAYEELLPKAVMDILVDRNIKVYTAERSYDKAAKSFVIKGTVANVHGIESGYGVYSLPEGKEGEDMLEKVNKAGEYVYGNVIGITYTLDQYMQKHVLDTIQYLVDTQGVAIAIRYMDALLPGLVKKVSHADGKEQYHLSVYNQQRNAAEYYMEFTPQEGKVPESWDYLSPRHCTISTGRADYKVNAITNLSGFPNTLYEGVTVALGLAVAAAHGRKVTQDAFEGYLAGTTNLWARTENYGLPLTTVQGEHYSLTDTLKVIIDNSGKSISSTPNMNVDSKGVALGKETKARWPYHMPCNSSLDLSVMEALMKKGELVLCDKYAMERIIIGDGARAMLASIMTAEDAAKLVAYNDNDGIGLEIVLDEVNGERVYSVCWPTDKASKALNRPWQFQGSSQAGEWKVPLEWAPLHTDLGNGKRSAVRGFKQTFIATNDWLNQGSGAASQHPAASVWSYGVNGSIRRTFSWSEVPATQENKDANGNHLRGLRPMLQGPDSFGGPSGKDKAGKDVSARTWFCETFAQKFVVKAIEAAMYDHKGQPRIYLPGEEMVVLFDAIYDKASGNKMEGFYPTGNTPGIPAARKVLFSNELGMQKCIITGYRLLPLNRGQDLQVVLEYATVMDTRDHNSEWSGAKARGLGIKFIISHDGTIDYLNHTAPHNGVEADLNDLYKQGAIHVTPEGLKGNYAFMQGFAAAHGNAYMSGPYLTIDQYLMDGTPNPHYVDGDARMVSDMTDTDSYFYQWMKSITRTIRMQKTLNLDEWHYIKACNKEAMVDGKLPGVTVVQAPHALQWDAEDSNGEQAVDDVPTITVEYDTQVCVFDYWVQVEVAPPGACTGNQGMTAEQAANLQVMLKDTATKLWERGANSRAGVASAVNSAQTHAQVEAGRHVPGIFYFDPRNKTHNELMEHLLYQVSATGVRTERKAEEFYNLLTALFGGNAPAADTTALWVDMVEGKVSSLDYLSGEVVFNEGGYNYLSVDGFSEHVTDALEGKYRGLGLAIYTHNEENPDDRSITYIDPTVFLQLGAFESHLVAADPKTHTPARRVTGAATGIVNDIHKAFLAWTTTEFWSRKGASSAVHGINCRLRNSMLGWIGVNSPQPTMMNAKGVLGRIARVGDYAGVAGKICTGIGSQYAPHVVTDNSGMVVGKLPVAIIHPDCLLAKGLKHNDIVGVGRTPTVSLAFAVVKFSRTYGRIGYIHMSFSVWAKGNNGDTDGDPCNRTRIGGTTKKGTWAGVTYRQAVLLNQHPLGMGGYDVVCGNDPSKHDCAEFVSFTAMWTKKVYNNNLIPTCIQEWAAVKGVKVKGLEPLVNLMLPASLLDSAKKVSQHYRANVGTAYGWCSAYSAHVKEKHSFLEAVVTQLLVVEKWCSLTLQQVMDVLVGGELHAAIAAGNLDAVTAKYPEVVALYNAKLNPSVGTAMDLAQMGQHIKVMLDASAWLWRGVYEGLGLSGYSPDASTFFQAFSSALRNAGLVCDMSTRDDKGKVTSIMVGRPGLDNGPDVPLAEFISTYYRMPLQVAEELFAACLLYNGYRAIERGQHVKAQEDKQPTTFEAYSEMYTTVMSAWADTKADEFVNHSVMAGVFRRAGQGTSGVSLSDDASAETSEEMIFTYAQKLWVNNLSAGKPVFRNSMINEIVVKSVSLYTQLSAIAGIGYEDYQ